MILCELMERNKKRKGFFVDIGAHHPVRFSNTYHFYKKGWKGINIDATPGSMKMFKFLRSRDINLELGVGLKRERRVFYQFTEPALNGFDKVLSETRETSNRYKIIKKSEIEILPLAEILDTYLPPNTIIDFMTIDVEGLNNEVLKSNNWEKYKPEYLLVEEDQGDEQISRFLNSKGYVNIARTPRTLFFMLKD